MSFRVVLNGQALPGFTPEQIAQHLRAHLKFSEAQVKALLPPSRRVVKRGVDRAIAEKWCRGLQQAGLAVVIEEESDQGSHDPLMVLQELANNGLKRTRPSPAYVLQLFWVTLCCLLVPTLYAGLVLGLGVGLVWYLLNIHQYLDGLRNIWLLLLIYGVPTISGGILLLFMARPFFLSSQHADEPLELDLAREPRLRLVINQLCQAIGLGPPVSVQLSNDVNASVHFENGWSGFFSGRKVLTIGMPLVAGMTVQQFVGVLGHEFGHFAQRLGMRCNFLLNSVNAWLEVRGSSRDPWDDRLQEWQKSDPWWMLKLAIWVAQQGIELSRLLMRSCFWLSFRLSRSMSRQMEFDADRYESLLAGSAAFRGSALQLRALSWAWREVDQQNARAWRERRLLRNMPHAIAEKCSSIGKSLWQKLEQSLEEGDTRYWHTHPADQARIRHSESLMAPGYLHDVRPASVLFERFEEHCQRVTQAYYADLRLDYDEHQLQDSQHIFEISAQREDALDQLWEWTGRQWRSRPWLPIHHPVEPAHADLPEQAVIDELRRRSPEISEAWKHAEAHEDHRVVLAWCGELERNGVQTRISDREVFDPTKHQPLYQQIDTGKTPAHLELIQAASLYRRRLELSLVGATTELRETARLALQLSKFYLDYARLVENRELAERFLGWHQRDPSSLTERLSQDAMLRYQDLALRLLTKADQIPQALLDGATLGGYLRLRCPRLNAQAGEPVEFLLNSGALLDSLAYAHRRVMAELASHALKREREQGLRGIRLMLNVGEPNPP